MDELFSELFLMFSKGKISSSVVLSIGQKIELKALSIYSDRVRVKQIFINLLSNAVKFTDAGSIEMGYFVSESGEVILYVKDTGIGIRKEDYQAIFNRFRKLNENSGKVYRGTGLGLAITQKLTELLGGKIWIESEHGKGSTFYFTLKDCALN
jgi:signal transduction histidine kinase